MTAEKNMNLAEVVVSGDIVTHPHHRRPDPAGHLHRQAPVTTEQELMAALMANLEAAQRALAAHETVALRALAEQEARLMDELRAVWASR